MKSKTGIIVFGGGCFWCTEAVFAMLPGVVKATPGYAGGMTKNPTFKRVAEGATGHAEVLKVEYDTGKTDLGKLLKVFFSMHDPTSVNQQGADIGSEYRSIILYTNERQKETIADYMASIAKNYNKPIATDVKKLVNFYPSEEEHKDFYKKNPLQPYCMFVIRPKVAKIKKEFNLQ